MSTIREVVRILVYLVLLALLFTISACGSLTRSTSASVPAPQNRVMPSKFQPEPRDILSQLNNFAGGGAFDCGNIYGRSNGSFGAEPFVALGGPHIERVGDPALLAGTYFVCIANFPIEETIKITLIEPSDNQIEIGTMLISEDIASTWNNLGYAEALRDTGADGQPIQGTRISWYMVPGMPEGTYRLIAESETASAQYNFEVQRPQSPILSVASPEIEVGNQFETKNPQRIVPGDQFKVMYAGFEPHQKISVFVGNTGNNVGPEGDTSWINARWVTEMDENGQAIDIVEIPESEITDALEETGRSFLGIESDDSVMIAKLYVFVALGEHSENDDFVILDDVGSYVDVFSN